MSLSPADTPRQPRDAGESPTGPALSPVLPPVRQGLLWTICFTILAFEIGGFLIVFPWMDAWHLNHFPSFYPPLFDIWDSPYFRGAISGLGLVDVMIALRQTVLLLKKYKNS
jgi:hypothetical protein